MIENCMLSSGVNGNSIILVVGGSGTKVAGENNDTLDRAQTSFADVLVLRGSGGHTPTVADIVDTMAADKPSRCLSWGVETWSSANMNAAINLASVAVDQPIFDVVKDCIERQESIYSGTTMDVSPSSSDRSETEEPIESGESTLNGAHEENGAGRVCAVVLARSKDLATAQVAVANAVSQHFAAAAEVNTTDLETYKTSMEESGGTVHHEVVSPQALMKKLPLSEKAAFTVKKARGDIARILDQKDDRVIAITGPCSIHDPRAALEYAIKLKKFADEHRNELVVVMRTYFEKPRTTVGWKGLLSDPDLDGTCDLNKGLHLCRSVLMRINEIGVPCAVEMLSNVAPPYFFDLVSWAAIGARTTESQIHREMVSGMDQLPVGFKNGTQGNVDIAVDAIECAKAPHSFLSLGTDGRACIAVSNGNPHCHVILRGGKQGPNFSAKFVADCDAATSKKNLRKRLIIDCSHGNSNKDHANQPKVVADISTQLTNGSQAIGGVMIESNLVEGAQKLDPGKTNLSNLTYGQSVTDACVSMDVTNHMFATLAGGVKRRRLYQ